MQLDFKTKEITLKLVYYGPALSGKTTNLQAIHALVQHEVRGDLMTLDTKDDRTLFFDLLPLTIQAQSGVRVRIKLFTVPGQVIHNSTRRLVLQSADGVAFIADSQRAETKNNAAAFVNLRQNLAENGLDAGSVPLVIQFNKRDMPDIRSDAEIDALASKGKEPVYKAVALKGQGVIETLLGLLDMTWSRLERTHKLHDKFGIAPEALLSELALRLTPSSETVSRLERSTFAGGGKL